MMMMAALVSFGKSLYLIIFSSSSESSPTKLNSLLNIVASYSTGIKINIVECAHEKMQIVKGQKLQ